MFKNQIEIKYFLVKMSLLAFPFLLPLPIPLNIKSIALIFFLVSLAISVKKEKLNIRDVLSDKVLIIFTLLYLLDPVMSLVRGDGFYFRDTRLLFITAPIIFLLCKHQISNYKHQILIVFLVGVFTYICFTILYIIYFYSQSEINFSFDYVLKYVTYKYLPNAIHHTYLGIYMCFALIFLLFSVKIKRATKLTLIFILFVSSLIIASKLSILFFLFIFFTNKKFFFLQKKINLFIILLVVLSLSILIFKTDLFNTLYNSVGSRKNIFLCALYGIKSNVLIGIGNYNIKDYMMSCNPAIGRVYTHNIFLQEFFSNGVFSLMAIVYLLFTLIKSFLKRKSFLGVMLLIMLCSFGQVEHVLNLQYGITFFVFFILLFYYSDDTKSLNV